MATKLKVDTLTEIPVNKSVAMSKTVSAYRTVHCRTLVVGQATVFVNAYNFR